MRVVAVINTIKDDIYSVVVPIKETLRVEGLAEIRMNFEIDYIEEYDDMVKALHSRGS